MHGLTQFSVQAKDLVSAAGTDRPRPPLRRGALLHRGGWRFQRSWHDFRRAQLFSAGREQMHPVVGLHQGGNPVT